MTSYFASWLTFPADLLLAAAVGMVLHDMKKVAFGQLGTEEFVSPLSASLMYFIITMGSGWALRTANRAVTPEPVKSHVANFLATLEMCAYFFENNFIYKHYGNLWLFIAVILECFVANRTFFGASENPCKPFTEALEKKLPVGMAALTIAVQALAGLASYRFARLVWSLDMVPDHRDRFFESRCSTDLNVALVYGFGLELGATLVDMWLGRQTLVRNPLLDEILKLANGSLMIVLGMTLTGMYFNPAMATGHTYGCHGTAAWEHLFVYWAGPFIGCFVAVTIDDMFHINVVESKKKKKKE